jgi:hypothetical protein
VRVANAQVEPARRADVARREDSHACEVARCLGASCEEIRLGIAEARDPVRAAQSGEVRVAVDESWDDRRARRVDDLSAGRIGRSVVGANELDPAVAHEDRDPAPQGRRATIGEGGAAKEDRRGRYLVFFPMVRMNVSIGMAVSVSIWTVPRAPSPTETRAIVSLSFASTMLTKS